MPLFNKAVLTIVSKIDEPYPGVRRFLLRDPDDWGLPSFLSGAHIDLYLRKDLVRTYSLCNVAGDTSTYEIAVKLEKSGRGGSAYIHDHLKEGMSLEVSLPRGGFRPSDTAMSVFIAGGIGITPFISAIRALEQAGHSNYQLHWASAGAPSLAAMLGPAQVSGKVYQYNTVTGRRPNLAEILASTGRDAHVYCCGPAGMLDEFESLTSAWRNDRVHIERFVPPPVMPSPEAKPFRLILARSGKEADVAADSDLVTALRALDANVAISCGGGICGACRTTWIEGPPIHRDRVLSPAERAHEVIVCVAQCGGPRLVLDI
jgi:ferredoxin-NADP reductase